MLDCKPIKMSVVFVGPFGVAPYTSPVLMLDTLLPEIKSACAGKHTDDVVADAATCKAAFSVRCGAYAVQASPDRLVVEANEISEESISTLSRIPERLAAFSPWAMAMGVGFNVFYDIPPGVNLKGDMFPLMWDGVGKCVGHKRVVKMEDNTTVGVEVFIGNNGKVSVNFNFDYRLALPSQKEPPLLVAKTWCAKNSFDAHVKLAESIMKDITNTQRDGQ